MDYKECQQFARTLKLGQIVKFNRPVSQTLGKHGDVEARYPEGALAVVSATSEEIEWATKVTIAIPITYTVPAIYLQEDIEVDFLTDDITKNEYESLFNFSCQILNERGKLPDWNKYHLCPHKMDNFDVVKAAHYDVIRKPK